MLASVAVARGLSRIERGLAQSANDLCVFVLAGVGSFTSSVVLKRSGWAVLQFATQGACALVRGGGRACPFLLAERPRRRASTDAGQLCAIVGLLSILLVFESLAQSQPRSTDDKSVSVVWQMLLSLARARVSQIRSDAAVSLS